MLGENKHLLLWQLHTDAKWESKTIERLSIVRLMLISLTTLVDRLTRKMRVGVRLMLIKHSDGMHC
jgi:hypothetical protein